MPHATLGTMVRISPGKEILLPKKFLDILDDSPETGTYLLVFRRATGIIRILPTKSSKAIKIYLEIGDLGTNFLDELGNIYESLKIQALFSTGLCFEEDRCMYEAFIDPINLTVTREELQEALEGLEGITAVELIEITT
ncbi:MAG: hypothetical protein ACFFCQ_13835 [Promethearchaeota archaeon]